MIPDHSYAALYAETVEHCREHGAFDPATMGSTPNIGLMAQAAEEYGSHDKTFEIAETGSVRVVRIDDGANAAGARGFRWRHLAHVPDQGRPDPGLGPAGRHARARNGHPGDLLAGRDPRPRRRGAAQGHAPALERARHRRGRDRDPRRRARPRAERSSGRAPDEDTISVTGNVLRDYLTDLFPILELGTSAKMLSIVPLMAGGGLFETGAGGSAPRHVQQFLKENHLRWDSLGEFLALGPSLELLADTGEQPPGEAAGRRRSTARPAAVLEEDRSPKRPGGRARQPGQPLLPRAVLGAGAGRAGRGSRAGRALRRAGGAAGRRTRRRSSRS